MRADIKFFSMEEAPKPRVRIVSSSTVSWAEVAYGEAEITLFTDGLAGAVAAIEALRDACSAALAEAGKQ